MGDMMRIFPTVAAAFLLCGGVPVCAEPADVASSVAAQGRRKLMVELDASRKPVEVLRFLGLKRGDRALDLFGSGGYYGEIMGRAVGPKGSVDAWEAPNFIDPKREKDWAALHRRLPNVNLLISPATRIRLPKGVYDFVMFNLDYHDLYWESVEFKFPKMDPKPFVRAIYASMKPGAVLGVIDHVAAPGGSTREVAQKLHRIDPATVRADIEAAGFVFDGESPVLRNPADDHKKSVFDPSIRYRTDQIVYRFRKPA